jgi:hypothetical protein
MKAAPASLLTRNAALTRGIEATQVQYFMTNVILSKFLIFVPESEQSPLNSAAANAILGTVQRISVESARTSAASQQQLRAI